MPTERDRKYAGPLADERLGSMSGAGSGLGYEGRVAYIQLDIELTDPARGLPIVRDRLRALARLGGAP